MKVFLAGLATILFGIVASWVVLGLDAVRHYDDSGWNE